MGAYLSYVPPECDNVQVGDEEGTHGQHKHIGQENARILTQLHDIQSYEYKLETDMYGKGVYIFSMFTFCIYIL